MKERTLKATGDKEAYRFLGLLEKGGLSATLRRQIGSDVGGACGQLRAGYLEKDGPRRKPESRKRSKAPRMGNKSAR